MSELLKGEDLLEDDYPTFPGYWYLVDGEPKRNSFNGTVSTLKHNFNAEAIHSCNAIARNLPFGDFVEDFTLNTLNW